MKAGGYILEPAWAGNGRQSPLAITLCNVTSSPARATTTKQSWSLHLQRPGQDAKLRLLQHHQEYSANLLTPNDSVVVAEATCDYKPLIFDDFIKRRPAAPRPARRLCAERDNLSKLRSLAAMLMQADNRPGPMRTFCEGGRRRPSTPQPR